MAASFTEVEPCAGNVGSVPMMSPFSRDGSGSNSNSLSRLSRVNAKRRSPAGIWNSEPLRLPSKIVCVSCV